MNTLIVQLLAPTISGRAWGVPDSAQHFCRSRCFLSLPYSQLHYRTEDVEVRAEFKLLSVSLVYG